MFVPFVLLLLLLLFEDGFDGGGERWVLELELEVEGEA